MLYRFQPYTFISAWCAFANQIHLCFGFRFLAILYTTSHWIAWKNRNLQAPVLTCLSSSPIMRDDSVVPIIHFQFLHFHVPIPFVYFFSFSLFASGCCVCVCAFSGILSLACRHMHLKWMDSFFSLRWSLLLFCIFKWTWQRAKYFGSSLCVIFCFWQIHEKRR